MAHDDEDGRNQTEYRKRQGLVEEVHQNRHQYGGDDRAERYDARRRDDSTPYGEDDERFPRSQEQDDAQTGGHALAAFKFQENRAGMADESHAAAEHHEVDALVFRHDHRRSGDLSQIHAEHTLGDVQDEDGQAAGGAEDAVGVRRARIMAAVVPRVRMVNGLADDQAARKGARDIR